MPSVRIVTLVSGDLLRTWKLYKMIRNLACESMVDITFLYLIALRGTYLSLDTTRVYTYRIFLYLWTLWFILFIVFPSAGVLGKTIMCVLPSRVLLLTVLRFVLI